MDFFSTLDNANKTLCNRKCYSIEDAPSVTKLIFDKSLNGKIIIETYSKSNYGSAIDKIYWKIISPSGKIYERLYDTKNNYKKGYSYATRTYSNYDVFDRDGTYTIETYVINEDDIKSSMHRETVYIDI